MTGMRTKRQVFYSFCFDDDVMRVQQIRNMGVVDGDEPVSPNDWESLRRTPGGIERWIDKTMARRSCVVVLVGQNTADRKWVKYEIKKAWNDNKGLFGVYIHNLKCPRTGICPQGTNPFRQFRFKDGNRLSDVVPSYNPRPHSAYADIRDNLSAWIEDAIAHRST